MFGNVLNRRVKFGILLVLVIAALIVVSGTVNPAQSCKKIKGQFTLQPVSGPACTSPVGICATGDYKGDIRGNSVFTASTLGQTVDTPTTSVVLVTGDNVFQTTDGNLTTKDAIVLKTTGNGEFAEVDTIIAGTGQWAGVTGTFSAVRTFTSAGGEGTYEGEICTP